MELNNYTDYQAAYSTGLLQTGQYCVVVVVKATFDFPAKPDAPSALSTHQIGIHLGDEFLGEPGYSSPISENDFATEKPKCDVVIHKPVAYAPNGQATERVEVGLQLGTINKQFAVVGPRHWEASGFSHAPSNPEAFSQLPLNWELAYGGVDPTAYEEEELSETYQPNPVGTGFWHKPKALHVRDTPVAQTEALDQPITKPNEQYDPQGFGPIARNWLPRSEYGGTYDEQWLRNRKPFLPDDFNPLYYQCAPPDQQMDYLQGGELVTLTNLTPDGQVSFILPEWHVPISATLTGGRQQLLTPKIDTLVIDPQAKRFTLVARDRLPFVHALHEIQQMDIGDKSTGELKVATAPCSTCG